MRNTALFIIFLFVAFSSQAQRFSILGKLTDTGNQGLPNATVLLLNEKDSTMVNYALSNSQGQFEIKDVARGNYLLRVSYIGFATRTLHVIAPSGQLLDMGTIQMMDQSTLLREIVVSEERIPMRVRNDTIEYDALAFKPLPNEKVEDLIRRMPGIEVQPDGSVVAQGETVRRVLVDGKEFFGRDPKMATQNLPADAISKVHVFDQRSEQSQFTGIDDGQRERTMNLELKEDRRQGAFGNTSLGYGPDNRFMGRTNLNQFDKNGQISLLAMGNNVNQQGFSTGDYMNFLGGAQSLMGGGGGAITIGISNASGIPLNMDGRPSSNGIMTSWAGGVNTNRKFGSKTELNMSYFYNQLDHDLNQQTNRENYLPSGNFDFEQTSIRDNQNYNHRLNLRLEHKFSEKSSLLLTANTGLNKTTGWQRSDSRTTLSGGQLQNQGEQFSQSESQRLNQNTNLLWRQRFSKPGRTLTSSFDFNNSGNKQDGSLEALSRFYRQTITEELIRQSNIQDNLNQTLRANLTYTEPLGNRRFLEANYLVSRNANRVDQQVYDLLDEGQSVNERLTNKYTNTSLFQRGGLNFRMNRDMYNLTIGASLQASLLEGNLETRNQTIERKNLNVLPVVRFNYEFSTFQRLMADYETTVQEPSILQLQPLIDNRDPLNIYVGNPDLRPAYRHRVSFRYNQFNMATAFGFFANISADYTTNAITNAQSVDEFLIRTTMPVNVQNNYSIRGNFNTNYQLAKIKSRFMLGTTLARTHSKNVLNGQEQPITNHILSGNFRYNFRPTDNFETNLSATVNQQLTAYAFSTTEQAFLNQTYGATVFVGFLKHYRLNTGFRYEIYQGRTAAFDQQIPMLDFGLSRSFLKNNAGELLLSGFNLLNRDLGVTQRADVNYMERSVTNSLGRYFLLSFTYSLNSSMNVFDQRRNRSGMQVFH